MATAIVAIVAAYRTFRPESMTAAVRLSEVRVDPRVKLAAFLERGPGPAASKPLRLARAAYVSYRPSLAQGQPETGEPSPEPPRPEPPEPDPTPPPDPTPNTETAPAPIPLPPDSEALRQDLTEQPPEVVELLRPEDRPPIALVELPPADSEQEQQRFERRAELALTGDSDAPDHEIREALAGSRLVRRGPIEQAQPGGPDLLVPFGAVVRFRLEPEGYKDQELEIRWSLFDARRRTRIPRRWLQDRLALRFTPRRNIDQVTEEFWVPLPKSFRGPFSVRVEVFDEEKVGLDSRDSRIP